MDSAKGKASHILEAIFVAAIMMVTMVTPALAQQGPEIRVTHSQADADQADVAIDSQGNVHIAYCDAYNTFDYEIWYTMLDNNGNTLIDDTRLTDDDGDMSKRPAIVVDSEDKVHIVWQDKSTDDLFYIKLDPSLDDQNGDAANATAITLVAGKQLMDLSDDQAAHQRIAIDSNDDIHIVWESPYNGYHDRISYMKIDNVGDALIPPTAIRVTAEWKVWRASPDVAVDSNDNPHITWNDFNNTDEYETYYMMLDGSDGSTLIDATLLTPDDVKSKRQSIVVDFEDRVHIIWKEGDWSAAPYISQIYYTKLDPSLDDQDGGAANATAITLIDDTALTPDDGHKRNLPTTTIQCGHYIHITWYEDWDSEHGPGYLHYMIMDYNGITVVADTALTVNKTAASTKYWTMAYLDVDCNGKAHITWCDNRDSPGNYTEVYYTSYQGPTADCCCKAPSPPPGVPTLSKWGVMGMIIALAGSIVWTLRRRKVSLNAP